MADNITLDPGTGGAVIATDDDGTAHHQYVKVEFGPDNTQTPVSTSNPLPVDLRTDNLAGNLDVNLAASGITLNVSSSVTAVVPGTGATNLGKAEDAAHSTGDVGVMALAVRQDTDSSLVGLSGDYAPLQVDATGRLKVEIFDGGDSHTVDGTVTANAGTGTFTVTDDGSFTLAANSGVDIGDVTINNGTGASAVNVQDGGNSLTVDGTVSVDNITTSITPGTAAGNLGKAEDAAHTSGDVGVMALAVRADADGTLVGLDGDYAPLQVDANGYLKVEIFDGGGSHTVDGTVTANAGTGTFTVTDDGSFTLAANSGVDIGDVTINNASGASAVNIQDGGNSITVDGTVTATSSGNVAHDGVDSGNPVKVGMRAVNHGATPTAVAAADRTDWLANRSGVPFMIGGHPNTEMLFQYNTAAQTDQVLKTVNANEKFVVTGIAVTCDNANTVDVGVILEFDDTADVPFFRHPGVPAGGGATFGDGSGILAIGAAAQDVLLTNEVPTTGGVAVMVCGYLITEA